MNIRSVLLPIASVADISPKAAPSTAKKDGMVVKTTITSSAGVLDLISYGRERVETIARAQTNQRTLFPDEYLEKIDMSLERMTKTTDRLAVYVQSLQTEQVDIKEAAPVVAALDTTTLDIVA